jgi:hypothetical protein
MVVKGEEILPVAGLIALSSRDFMQVFHILNKGRL